MRKPLHLREDRLDGRGSQASVRQEFGTQERTVVLGLWESTVGVVGLCRCCDGAGALVGESLGVRP